MPMPHETIGLIMINVWIWIIDRPTKICKILIEGLLIMS